MFPDNLLFLRSSIETFVSNVSGITPDNLLSCMNNATSLGVLKLTCEGMPPDKLFAERSSS